MRAGPMPSVACRNSGSTGSSIEIVAAMATTAAAQAATAGTRSTDADRHRLVRRAAIRDVEPEERDGAGKRQRRHEEERQPDAAGLVQPAAERRAEHEGEARARHHVGP